MEAESPSDTGSDIQSHERALDGDGAGAAHRIEQWNTWAPAGEAEQSGGEVFAQRRFRALAPVAALEQRLTGSVEVERCLRRAKVGVHPHVGMFLAYAGTDAGCAAVPVAHGILYGKRCELQTLQRRARGGDVDPQRALRAEVTWPVDVLCQPVDVALIAVRADANLP